MGAYYGYTNGIILMMIYILIALYLQFNVSGKSVKIPAIFMFGDSIVDTGNNNYINTIAKSNFPPYGRDFLGGVPTGRFCNGKIVSDYIAEAVGIKDLVPPYLDPSLKINDLLTSVSFASAAAGFDPITAALINTLSLEDQLKLFKQYISKLKATVGENATSTIISQSFYLISSGSNDITTTYSLVRRFEYDFWSYAKLMVNWASIFVQELYALGARRIAVVNVLPCGCLPSQRTLNGGLLRECATKENHEAKVFNMKLNSEFRSLKKKLLGLKIAILDVYTPLLNLILNPSRYGFEVVNKGCCGTGDIEVTFLCNKLHIETCINASKYVFWDSFHPTEAANIFIVRDVTSQKSFKDLLL